MAFQVKLYAFSKAVNSTKQAPTDQGSTYQGEFKEDTSIFNPIVRLNLGSDNPKGYNYAYIALFSRYYFINDWTYSTEGFWIASMAVDAMASFKTSIGGSTEYVLRSSYTYDGTVSDAFYPATCRSQCKNVQVNSQLVHNLSEGCYILNVINNSQSGVGSNCLYALTNAQFRQFNEIMLSGVDWLNIDFSTISDMNDSFFKTLFNPYQYVVSCMWFPIQISSLSTQDSAGIKYGWWTIGVSCKRLTSLEYSNTVTATLPSHPQASRGSYLNFQPYTKLYLHWPVFGDFELDPLAYYHSRTCNIQYTVDLMTGRGTCYPVTAFAVSSGTVTSDSVIYSAVEGQVGVPISVTQMATNILGAIQSIGGAVGGGIQNAMSVDFMGAAQSLIGGVINSAINMHRPTYDIVGSTGGFNNNISALFSQPVIECTFMYVVDDDNIHNGRPLYQDKLISSIPGYIVCANPRVEIQGATRQEEDMIHSYMSGGFYYE